VKIVQTNLAIGRIHLVMVLLSLNHSFFLLQILTPEQSARYIEWMHKNQERMRRCGVEQEITLLAGAAVSGHTTQEGTPAAAATDPKLRAACEILKKPDAELTLADVEVLLSVSEG
jgi:hypothetical protein